MGRLHLSADYGGHPCGRKVAGTLTARARFAGVLGAERPTFEQPACAMHLGHERRRQEREAARLQERREERDREEEARRRCRVVDDVIELFAQLDLGDGRAVVAGHTHGKWGQCDGRVALDPEVARAIAMRLMEQEAWS